ncbi:hypothetical protein IFM61392_10421 [Aspergillus lentulus]|nr:hypothetical protein IFM47457_10996 [Aspergillus lentulus]GFG18174.1 hypothetical protein IFM61392_10421 [Aspergillus lentulus]
MRNPRSGHNSTSSLVPARSLPDLPTGLSESYLHSLIPGYMTYVYPFNPIMTGEEIRVSIREMATDRDHAAFVCAFSGVVLDATQSNAATFPVSEYINKLAGRAVKLRSPLLPGFRPSILQAVTSIFIQICYMSLGQYDLGLFYLREAISIVYPLRINDEAFMAGLDLTERCRRQRLYWLCFIHERFRSVLHFSPAMMHPCAQLPQDDPTLEPNISHGWSQLIKTFLLLDPTFISLWTGDRSQVTIQWIERKHREFNDEGWNLEASMLSHLQQADLVLTRQWMQTLLWQMAVSNCLLSTYASCPSLSLGMPLRLSDQLRQFLGRTSRHMIQIHGSSILSKLLEMVNIIADVVIHGPQLTPEEKTSKIDDILYLKEVIFSFRTLQPISKRILTEKLHLIQQRFAHVGFATQHV